MDIGDPVIYNCPSCGKEMMMTTFTSYTVSSSGYYSDGYIQQSGVCCPDFTPDLAKCPHCKSLFFRHNVKDARSVNFYINKVKEDIEEPDRDDLINAVKNKITKNRKEEIMLRKMLWRSFNNETREGYEILSGYELQIWKNNCASLLPLTEKTLKEMQSEKNINKYSDEDRENCLIMIAELNRNLGNFDVCMEIIKELPGKWSWLKKQFAWECKAKNIFTFELMTKKEMNLEKAKNQNSEDYINRAYKFLPKYYGRRDLKKALDDFNKAESLGMKDSKFYKERGLFFLDELNDPDNAIADFTQALKFKQKNKNSRIDLLKFRSFAYLKKGNFKKALADIQTAIDENNNDDSLYTARSEIYEAMGETEAAENDKRKAEELIKKEQEKYEAMINKPFKIIKKGVKSTIDEL